MKCRPILMSAPMVRACLNDTKTQTRRIVKPQPPEWAQHVNEIRHLNIDHRWVPSHLWQWSELQTGKKLHRWPTDPDGDGCDGYAIPCPYGQPGDRLWVKETYRFGRGYDGVRPNEVVECNQALIQYAADGSLRTADGHVLYGRDQFTPGKLRPSIHMPRAISRLTLEITEVRVQRLQAISEEDALAEGIQAREVIISTAYEGGRHVERTAVRYMHGKWPTDEVFDSATDAYADLWESINGPGSWDANPWVWCVSFKRVAPWTTWSHFFPIEPMAKARPRLSGGHVHMPRDYMAWRQRFIALCVQHGRPTVPLAGRLSLSVGITTKSGKMRPDLDNVVGAIQDALQDARVIKNDRDVRNISAGLSCDPGRVGLVVTVTEQGG
jgi:Holliday junction resolvase RusA-like endonuclease